MREVRRGRDTEPRKQSTLQLILQNSPQNQLFRRYWAAGFRRTAAFVSSGARKSTSQVSKRPVQGRRCRGAFENERESAGRGVQFNVSAQFFRYSKSCWACRNCRERLPLFPVHCTRGPPRARWCRTRPCMPARHRAKTMFGHLCYGAKQPSNPISAKRDRRQR